MQEALRIKPDFSKAHYCLGLLYYHLARWDEAVYHYEAALRTEPGMAEAYYDLGCVWQQRGQHARAIASFKNALLARPNYPEAYNNLGNVLAEEGNLQEAMKQYQLALQIFPNYSEAHYNLGVKLAQLNRPDEAMLHFQRVIQLMPTLPDAYIQLAGLLDRKGRFADAIATLKSGLATNRHNPVFANEYAWLLVTCPVKELRDSTQAIQIGEALARATSRKTPQYLDTLAAAYADADRFAEAVPVAREALSLAQSNNDTNLAAQLAMRLTLYEKGQPFRLDSP